MTHALERAIERQIEADYTLTPHSTVHFTMQSNTFTHAFQSTTFTVREFEDGTERLETYLQALAAKLNTNEEFSPDDTFTLETTFIRTPGPGHGHGKRYKPSAAAVRGITKTSRVTIKNEDELCCARAIVTMKVYVDAATTLVTQTTTTSKRVVPSNNAKLKNFIVMRAFPKSLVEYPNFDNFRPLCPVINSKWCPLIHRTW